MNPYRLIDVQPSDEELGHAARPLGLSHNDSLFAMLDGQIIQGRSGAWRVEVVSIFSESNQTWVQIGPAMRPSMSVVLRMGQDQRADQALDALRAWTDLPEERRPDRIEVAPR